MTRRQIAQTLVVDLTGGKSSTATVAELDAATQMIKNVFGADQVEVVEADGGVERLGLLWPPATASVKSMRARKIGSQ